MPTDRTGWAGDDGGAERLIMRKNKFLMNNKESGDKTGERRGDKRLSLAPPGYNINICYQVVNSSDNMMIKPPTLQLLPTLAANLGSFSAGLAVGFPALLEPRPANNTVRISLNMSQPREGLEEETLGITEDQSNLIGG